MKYDLDYYERTLYLNSVTSEKISNIRWNFVKQSKAKTVLDFGSGVPWFRVFRPPGVEVDTYDVGIAPQTGIRRKEYDLITFWDVLEHLSDLNMANFMLHHTEWAAVTVPILPDGVPLYQWHHYKPGEHVATFTEFSIVEFFNRRGFGLIKSGSPECKIRKDIGSFLFKRD